MSTTTASTTRKPRVRVTHGKIAQKLEVGDVLLTTYPRPDGTHGVSLDTVTEIVRNELGEKDMTVHIAWSFGKNRRGESIKTLNRFDYVNTL